MRRTAGRTARGPRAGMLGACPASCRHQGQSDEGQEEQASDRHPPAVDTVRTEPNLHRVAPTGRQPPLLPPVHDDRRPVRSLPAWLPTRRWRCAAARGPRSAGAARPAGARGSTRPRSAGTGGATSTAPPSRRCRGSTPRSPAPARSSPPASSETRSSAVQGSASTVAHVVQLGGAGDEAVRVVRPLTSTVGPDPHCQVRSVGSSGDRVERQSPEPCLADAHRQGARGSRVVDRSSVLASR